MVTRTKTTESPSDAGAVEILLVDDRPENLRALEAVLSRPDYHLVTARSGEEALAAVLRHNFALILLDVAMPGMNGFETATLIRQRRKARGVPIIFVTAMMSDEHNYYRGYEAGAVDYLTKPIDNHTLKAKVSVFVEMHRLLRHVEESSSALASAEALYQVTFEKAPVGIGHLTLDGEWLRANTRLAEIVGAPATTILGHTIRSSIHPDDRTSFDQAVDQLRAGQIPRLRGDYRFVRMDESVVWTNLTLSLIRDPLRQPLQLAIIEDLTGERRLSEALRVSEDRFARLRESGVIGVFVENPNGTVTEANEAFLRMLGFTIEDLAAGRITTRAPVDVDDETEARARMELATRGVCAAHEREFMRKDGRRINAMVGATVAERPSGDVVGFVIDVTERKELERERARHLAELRETLRTRDDFVSLTAHELRNPLTPIEVQIANLRELARTQSTMETVWLERQLVPVARAARRLSGLVDQLLDVSRITVGRLRIEHEEVDLVATIRDVVERMRPEAEHAGCAIQMTATEEIRGSWDRVRIEQAIGNILSNAIKYGAGKAIEITVEGDARVGRFAIRDHGIGIDPKEQSRIFERFERLVPVRHYGGFGLGLWIVRQIVEAHGGSVDVWSKPGEGSRFTVELPRTTTTEHHETRGSP